MSENNQKSQEEVVKQIYSYAADLKKQGLTKSQIKQKLVEQGLDDEVAKTVISNLDKVQEADEDSGSGAGRWLIYIVILVVVNVLSAVFDWGFWIY